MRDRKSSPSLFSLKPPACGLQLGLWGMGCCPLCPRRSDSSCLHQPPSPSSSQRSTLHKAQTPAASFPNTYGGCALHSAYWSQLLHGLLSRFSSETTSSHVVAQRGLPKTLLSRRKEEVGRTGAKHGCSHPFTCCSVSGKSRKTLNAGGGGSGTTDLESPSPS